MPKRIKRIFAAAILLLLITIPFFDWKLGAVLWICAWLVFIFQNLYSGRSWRTGGDQGDEEHQK